MQRIEVDFVSDVACPWCAVGLTSLQSAIKNLGSEFEVVLRMQPFELNPNMAAEGEDVDAYLHAKYGSTPEQMAGIRQTLAQRGAENGFAFNASGRGRIWNTFDAHRLLHWAGLQDDRKAQETLKLALLTAYHGRAENPSSKSVLLACAQEAGLNAAQAEQVLNSDLYAAEVRAEEQKWQRAGISSVPAAVLNGQYLVSGGQTAETFESALRQAAAG